MSAILRSASSDSWAAPETPEYAPCSTSTILVVEDDGTLCNLLVRHGALRGYTCFRAEDGQEGLYLAQLFRPAVALVDCALPGMNGFQLLRALRADPVCRELPVIGMSGYPIHPAAQTEFTAFLQKPFELETLNQVLEPFLSTTRPLSARRGRAGVTSLT